MLSLQAPSSSLNAGAAKGGCLGRGEASWCPPAVCLPERPRPSTHYRFTVEPPRNVSGANFQWNDSDSGPKVRVTGQKSELRPKSQSYSRADPQNPNRIAQKNGPRIGFRRFYRKPPLKPSWIHLNNEYTSIGVNFRNFETIWCPLNLSEKTTLSRKYACNS